MTWSGRAGRMVFLSTEGTKGGAAIVTARLVEALRLAGTDARMLVGRNCGPQPWMAEAGGIRRPLAKLAERGEIFLANGFDRADLWKVSTGRFGADVCSHPWVREADVVVIGWICQGFLSLSDISRLCRSGKRVVWWMHDLWCATGICHLPGDCPRFEGECGDCPLLHRMASRNDLSHRVWERKKRIFSGSGIRFLAVSQWQKQMALRSSLLGGENIEVLPHAFPVEEYEVQVEASALPERLSFLADEPDVKWIVMGAARLDDPVKNLPAAIESLNLFASGYPDEASHCKVVFFGGLRDADALRGLAMPYHHAGTLNSDELKYLYASATVVLSTSHFETMGATLMEGMAAGATPVTFGRGGQGDIVTHGVNGYIADYGSAASVAACLVKAVATPFPRAAQHASVEERFSAGAVVSRFLSLRGL